MTLATPVRKTTVKLVDCLGLRIVAINGVTCAGDAVFPHIVRRYGSWGGASDVCESGRDRS